ncbi:MAG: efflux RND transporter periplasmic adaptor subunit [Treponema sp.]|nr:efflux RND transporter periplasmic adaptor subunit [Treponema sp.]
MKVFIIFLTIILFSISCDKNKINAGSETKMVRGTAAYARDIPDEAGGFGSLSFLSKVDVTSPQDAVIKRIYFREGEYVKQGDLIIQLENPQIVLAVQRAENNYSQALAARSLSNSKLLEGVFQAEAQLRILEKADAELTLAKKRWEENYRKHLNQETLYSAGGIHTEAILVSRFGIDTELEQIQLMEKELEIRRIGCRDQDLIRAGFSVPLDETERQNALVRLMTSILRAELEAAGARVEAAEKELTSANIALSELTVRSPISGIVGVCFLEEGERVRPYDKIISIIDTTSLYAIFPVREKDALRIENGMKASVLVDGTGEIKSGAVNLVYPQADTQSLSFFVRVLLENTNNSDLNNLKPGMFVRVTITLGPPKTAVFIPESSIFNKKNNEGNVFLINGKVVSERKIIFGSVYGEDREIISGINIGDYIVLRPDSDLREGTNVSVFE